MPADSGVSSAISVARADFRKSGLVPRFVLAPLFYKEVFDFFRRVPAFDHLERTRIRDPLQLRVELTPIVATPSSIGPASPRFIISRQGPGASALGLGGADRRHINPLAKQTS